jgi:D-methionine transport system substrate-binding protein
LFLSFAFAGSAMADNPKTIRIGVTAGPYADILRYAGELAAKEGIDLKITAFTDYPVPNAALAQDDLSTRSRGRNEPARCRRFLRCQTA